MLILNLELEEGKAVELVKGASALVEGIKEINKESEHLFTSQALAIVESVLYEAIKKLDEKNEG